MWTLNFEMKKEIDKCTIVYGVVMTKNVAHKK